MSSVYDPVAEAQALGTFPERGPIADVPQMRGVGGEVAWYLRPDGQAVRLPADIQSRDYYERKGFVFKRAWGVYARTPVEVNGRDVLPETEWEQLARLARQHPDESERLAIRSALGKVFSTASRIADEVIVCVCGTEYTRRAAYENHLYGCARAIAAEAQAEAATGPAEAAASPPVAAPGPVAKPPKPFTCKRCDPPQVFPSQSEYAVHAFTHRRRDINGKFIDRPSATNAA